MGFFDGPLALVTSLRPTLKAFFRLGAVVPCSAMGPLRGEGPDARDVFFVTTAAKMSRRGMHPSLMKCNQTEAKKPSSTELSGYESAQRKRFLRSEEDVPDADDEQVA